MSNQIAFYVGLGFTLAGLAGLKYSYSRYKLAKESTGWPTCIGTLKNAKMIDFGAQGRNYDVHAEYNYTIAGKKYSSRRVSFFSLAQKHECEEIIKGLETSEQLLVSYNPDTPQESTLITGHGNKKFGDFFISLVALICGILTLLTNL